MLLGLFKNINRYVSNTPKVVHFWSIRHGCGNNFREIEHHIRSFDAKSRILIMQLVKVQNDVILFFPNVRSLSQFLFIEKRILSLLLIFLFRMSEIDVPCDYGNW